MDVNVKSYLAPLSTAHLHCRREPLLMKSAAMQDLDSDLFNFDTFFTSNNDEAVDGLWGLSATPDVCHDGDIFDDTELEPLSSTKEDIKQEQAQVKQVEPTNKFGLKIDPKLNTSSRERWLSQSDNVKTNGTPTSTLPARFALLSTTCVYEPGFTTSPRGKRRISQIHVAPSIVDPQNEDEDRDEDEDESEDEDGNGNESADGDGNEVADGGNEATDSGVEVSDGGNEVADGGNGAPDGGVEVVDDGDDEPFMLLGVEDYNLPVFTDAELSAMVESPLEASSASDSSAVSSLPLGLTHGSTTVGGNSIIRDATNTLPIGVGASGGADYVNLDVNNMFNSISGSSHNFPEAQQQIVDLTGSASSSTVMAPCIVTAPSQAMFVTDPGMPFNASSVMPVSIAPNDYAPSGGIPYDYFSPSGYAAAANQSLESYQQQVQPFVMQPDAALFHGQQAETNDTNVQIAAAVAMANSADINTMHRMNGNYGVSIAPLQHRAGSMFSTAQVNVAGPLKLPLPAQRANCATSASAFTSNKGSRFAITPDIADFKLVQIFYQFCDPATKVLTLPRFQQLLLYHQIKDKTLSKSDSATDVTSDLQTLFRALDIKNVGSLDLERFMSSFQICNRCTEVKRRAHQALCASQGQTFTSTALERQLMEDVAPVIVRVVPTCYEGPKVKSCEHYQWTWCEGYDKTGNDKCRGTNRHDKCPKYLANCTLWKHKLPPKNRKPRVLLENVDSPTKKFKHFS